MGMAYLRPYAIPYRIRILCPRTTCAFSSSSFLSTLDHVLSPPVFTLDSILPPSVSTLDSISYFLGLTLTTFPTITSLFTVMIKISVSTKYYKYSCVWKIIRNI